MRRETLLFVLAAAFTLNYARRSVRNCAADKGLIFIGAVCFCGCEIYRYNSATMYMCVYARI